MNLERLKKLVAKGEDSRLQFKENVTNGDQLAAEMVAFANAEGGQLLLGVDKNGKIKGFFSKDVERVNQLISNTASQNVRSPLTLRTTNVSVNTRKVVIVVTVPRGLDKPYFDRKGVIWFRNGSDKRRINSKEELCRLFQSVGQFHADEMPTRADFDMLDKSRLEKFVKKTYGQALPQDDAGLRQILSNMNLLADNGKLNLAGVLLFAEHPEWVKPVCIVKAVSFPGDSVAVDSYLDSEDYAGPMEEVFKGTMSFIMRNLHKIQAGQSVNSLGKPEISPVVFEELLVNALIHRDYFVSATIRVLVFKDRIEVISPGHLPNNLTIDKIRAGNSNIRNPIIASFIAKGLLPYRGLGSGIKRALDEWEDIDFVEDREGNLFTVTIHRNLAKSSEKWTESSEKRPLYSEKTGKSSEENAVYSEFLEKGSDKSSDKILEYFKLEPSLTAKVIAERIGMSSRAVEKQIAKLQKEGRLRRVGSKKSGYWEVLNENM